MDTDRHRWISLPPRKGIVDWNERLNRTIVGAFGDRFFIATVSVGWAKDKYKLSFQLKLFAHL